MHPHLAATVLLSAVVVVLVVPPVVPVATSRRAMRHQPEQEKQPIMSVIAPSQTLLQMHLTTGKDIGGCFERIAIGRRLADVTVSTPLAMLPECEMKCFLSPDCRAFSFGMGRHGNGTCEMQHGTAAERLARRRGRRPRRLEPTQQPEDPDYDLFERRADCETPASTQQPPDEDDRAPPPLLLQELVPQPGDREPGRLPDREEPEPMMTCFRRLFSGRRLAERHIRRSLPTPSAIECEMACTREQQFECEGFNFRADRQRLGRGSCELSARPHGELGPALLRDFIEDREYDFFERRRGGPPECAFPGGGNMHPGDYRPSPSHHAGVSGPPGNWNSGGPPQRYGPQQGPNQHQGPQYGPHQQGHQRPHGPNPSYGPHQQEPQHGPHQQGHHGSPQFGPPQQRPQYGPHQQGHQGPQQFGPQQGPQYGPHQQGSRPGSSPAGAPWSPGSVGFYGPAGAGHGMPHGGPGGGYGGGHDGHGGGHGGPGGEHGGHGGGHGGGGPSHGGPPGGYGQQGGGPPGGFGRPDGGHHKNDDECFARVWSGQRLDDSAIRASASHPSLGGCQLECLHAREFICRAFSYRHGPPHAGDSCLLTDRPVAELHPRIGLISDPVFEFYERSSFGNGCEHIPQYPSSLPWNQGNFHGENNQLPPLLAQPIPPGRNPGPHQSGEHECYAEYWPSARLSATAVSVATHAPSISDCLSRCTGAEQQWHTPCRSLAYRGGVHGHNCLLSELAQRDLRPDMDFVHDGEGSGEESWRLMAWDWSDARCREPPPGARPQQLPGGYPGGPQGGPHGGPPQGGNNLQPWDSLNRDKGVIGGGGNSWGAGGGGGGAGGSPLSFTVSGKPCARGHTCQLNQQAGFWSCPLDEGSGKEWDYCCSPSHHCGYSEGMQIPWCYVGHSKDQWRPCSERYWPYSGNNKNSDREGRFLPVAFLHRSGPPGHEYRRNGTTFESTNSLRSLRMLPVNTTESFNSSRQSAASDLRPISLTVVTSKVK